eukprot:TRINITY_DN10488_c0_g1_i2.p1 TRINITY_DN10488_c0_g1~~TRINITY_DN10488_c0_g1_i2.p1  ORF type:complete len:203 (+),score=12.65 TRINITY_DN10488_c0_g1_i2:119-727(+)
MSSDYEESFDDSLPSQIVAPSVANLNLEDRVATISPVVTVKYSEPSRNTGLPTYKVVIQGKCAHCSGVYIASGEHVNGHPYWENTAGHRWLYSTPNGYWRFTNTMRDFPTGAGYVITTEPHDGIPPHHHPSWRSKHFSHVPVAFSAHGAAALPRLKTPMRSASRSGSPGKAAKYLAALHKQVLPDSPIRNRTLNYNLVGSLS